jgi:endonuclease/exonuclease/phosphatase family metal-dependent hydrolase
VVRVLTWNLFHGRDFPPNPRLRTWRSRLTRRAEVDETHMQVNADLQGQFARVIAGAEWDIALLQECPPRFLRPLAAAARGEAQRAFTSRNSLLPLTQWLARRNPDLIASWEGGSNVTLVRGSAMTERRSVILRRFPERRVMALARLASGICVANLHASARADRANEDVRAAAATAVAFAGGRPLIFGGDLNLRPAGLSLFDELAAQGFTQATAPDSIDHVMAQGGAVVQPPAPWPAERREVMAGARAIRLSDHAPVEAVFEFAAP